MRHAGWHLSDEFRNVFYLNLSLTWGKHKKVPTRPMPCGKKGYECKPAKKFNKKA